VVLDLPAATTEPPVLQWLAVAADPWPGAVAVFRSEDGASFDLHRIVPAPAMIGRTLTGLGPGPLWRFDRVNTVEIEVSSGHLASVGEGGALGGLNLFALVGPDGRCEILAAAEAILVGERSFRLATLIRGLSGSEAEAGRTVPAGSTIVRLDEAVVPLAQDLVDLGRPWRYRIGPADRDHADRTYLAFEATAGALALTPLRPVHVEARRLSEGVRISFIRRTRRDGDPWEPVEVPLGESVERYEIDILAAGTVRRTLAATAPAAVYPVDQEIADFGAPQAALDLRVVQTSAAAGRGFATSVRVPVGPA
jgi:hypothetical protein